MNSLTKSVVLIFIIIEHAHISSVKLVLKSQGFMGARTAVTMIDVVRQTVEDLFGSAAVAPFCDGFLGGPSWRSCFFDVVNCELNKLHL